MTAVALPFLATLDLSPYAFVFVDADKKKYKEYYNVLLRLPQAQTISPILNPTQVLLAEVQPGTHLVFDLSASPRLEIV